MSKIGHLALLVTVLSPLTHAWWIFNRDEEGIRAVGNVSADCLQQANQGSCQFYTCLESRFSCGRHAYALKHGHYYCNKFNNFLHMFNEEGRQWVAASRRCMTMNLKTTYHLEEVTCKAITREGFRTLSDCFLRHGFCEIMWDNKEALLKVLEAEDLVSRLSAIRIWQEILDLARGCSGGNIRRFLEFLIESLGIHLPIHG